MLFQKGLTALFGWLCNIFLPFIPKILNLCGAGTVSYAALISSPRSRIYPVVAQPRPCFLGSHLAGFLWALQWALSPLSNTLILLCLLCYCLCPAPQSFSPLDDKWELAQKNHLYRLVCGPGLSLEEESCHLEKKVPSYIEHHFSSVSVKAHPLPGSVTFYLGQKVDRKWLHEQKQIIQANTCGFQV